MLGQKDLGSGSHHILRVIWRLGLKNHGFRWWLACIVIDSGVKPTEIYTQSPPCHARGTVQPISKPCFLTCETLVNPQGVLHELSLAKHLVVSFLVLWDKLLSCSSGWFWRQSPFTERPEKGKSSRMARLAPLSHHGVSTAELPLCCPTTRNTLSISQLPPSSKEFLFIFCFHINMLIETPQK